MRVRTAKARAARAAAPEWKRAPKRLRMTRMSPSMRRSRRPRAGRRPRVGRIRMARLRGMVWLRAARKTTLIDASRAAAARKTTFEQAIAPGQAIAAGQAIIAGQATRRQDAGADARRGAQRARAQDGLASTESGQRPPAAGARAEAALSGRRRLAPRSGALDP